MDLESLARDLRAWMLRGDPEMADWSVADDVSKMFWLAVARRSIELQAERDTAIASRCQNIINTVPGMSFAADEAQAILVLLATKEPTQ
jgi:hypothetical protein